MIVRARIRRVQIIDDCDSVGGLGDFALYAEVEWPSGSETFRWGSRDSPRELGNGDRLDPNWGYTSQSLPTTSTEPLNFYFELGGIEYDVSITGPKPDPSLGGPEGAHHVLIPADPPTGIRDHRIVIGSDDCFVALDYELGTERVVPADA